MEVEYAPPPPPPAALLVKEPFPQPPPPPPPPQTSTLMEVTPTGTVQGLVGLVTTVVCPKPSLVNKPTKNIVMNKYFSNILPNSIPQILIKLAFIYFMFLCLIL